MSSASSWRPAPSSLRASATSGRGGDVSSSAFDTGTASRRKAAAASAPPNRLSVIVIRWEACMSRYWEGGSISECASPARHPWGKPVPPTDNRLAGGR